MEAEAKVRAAWRGKTEATASAEEGLHDAVWQLDTAAGELVVIAQRAVEAAQKRGDEIDAMLADIRRVRAA